MYHEMRVFGFTIDAIANRPVVILKDVQDNNTIPVWISTTEAFAIAAELVLEDNPAGRRKRGLMPLFLEKTGTRVGSICIEGLHDGVFTASVKFLRGDEEFPVEVGASEAIRVALGYRMPILVAEDVLQQASLVAMSGEELAGELNARRFTEFLDNLDPATLGKYPM
jgi:bifunctional DNase/RNase